MNKEERRREYEENMKKIDPVIKRKIYGGMVGAVIAPIIGVLMIVYALINQIKEAKLFLWGVLFIFSGLMSIIMGKYYYNSRVDAIKEKEKENKEDSIKEGETQQ